MNSKDLTQAAVAKKMLETVILNKNRIKARKIMVEMFKDTSLLKDCNYFETKMILTVV